LIARVPDVPGPERPRLELSGPRLARALEVLVSGSEEHGGVERYVHALQLKSRLFQEALEPGRGTDLAVLKGLFAHLATVRRHVGAWLVPPRIDEVHVRIRALLDGREDTSTTDARVATFCAAFPGDREHRWVRDLAAEILHNVDPERYPLMCRWVWDARTNTGVIREIWHPPDPGCARIDVPDGYATFVMLREELAQFLSANGVFRDVVHYIDLLTAQVYAGYISGQGASYLRVDFSTPEDPLLHTRRLLGLDGIAAGGRSKLKAADGVAVVVDQAQRLN
jgi:hypothetical protein